MRRIRDPLGYQIRRIGHFLRVKLNLSSNARGLSRPRDQPSSGGRKRPVRPGVSRAEGLPRRRSGRPRHARLAPRAVRVVVVLVRVPRQTSAQ